MDPKSEETNTDLVLMNDFERRVWVAAFEQETRVHTSPQMATDNADYQVRVYRRRESGRFNPSST
jgi:hypothetical protein